MTVPIVVFVTLVVIVEALRWQLRPAAKRQRMLRKIARTGRA